MNKRAQQIQVDNVYKGVKKITEVLRTNQWSGGRCFIVGGGESLKGFDFDKLNGELTIGINRSFERIDSTLLYLMDSRLYRWLINGDLNKHDKSDVLQKWNNFKGHKIFLCPLAGGEIDDEIYAVRRIIQPSISLNLNKGIHGSNNSGLGAIMLAIALGANPMYLLGFDMKCSTSTHWHSGYPNQNADQLQNVMTKYVDEFEKFAPVIESLGFRVVNLNPNSGVTCFEFDDIDRVLRYESNSREVMFVSYYTKDTGYEEEAKKLISSLEKFNLPYDVEAVDNFGSWQSNTSYKAMFCKKMLEKHRKPIVFVDADAIIQQDPILFGALGDYDVAMHYKDGKELLSGTLYFNNTKLSRAVINEWIKEVKKDESIWEQKNLAKSIEQVENNEPDFKLFNLPATYCQIFDSMKDAGEPVVEHFQASRKLKRGINNKGKPVCERVV